MAVNALKNLAIGWRRTTGILSVMQFHPHSALSRDPLVLFVRCSVTCVRNFEHLSLAASVLPDKCLYIMSCLCHPLLAGGCDGTSDLGT